MVRYVFDVWAVYEWRPDANPPGPAVEAKMVSEADALRKIEMIKMLR